ncbi:membrane-bound lytic murein transglycosylase D [Pseudomonas aeruginosa]|nr:membrane-bound lytic murein transglycosylase D [Pseudomonas aeruginosa]
MPPDSGSSFPATGQHFNLRQTNFYDGRRDITASTNAALTYLERLHDMFNGDWMLALAAYNAGEGTVSRAIERNEKLGLPTDYWNLPLPQETQDYVPKLLALSQIVMAPDSYGISLNPINNEPYFQAVRVKRGIDLSSVAALADLDEDELYQVEPGLQAPRDHGRPPATVGADGESGVPDRLAGYPQAEGNHRLAAIPGA